MSMCQDIGSGTAVVGRVRKRRGNVHGPSVVSFVYMIMCFFLYHFVSFSGFRFRLSVVQVSLVLARLVRMNAALVRVETS